MTWFTVSQVARRSGVSVRTLRHYDAIGLLRPSQMSPAGYLGAGMEQGPGDPGVQAAVAALYQHINLRFYVCPPEVFRGLADLYVTDARFTATWDRVRPGLAAFLGEAMHQYCSGLPDGTAP